MIAEAISDYDMAFITCGMGGGTGTGASPVVAKIAKDKGILTVAVVTKPFRFEGTKRMKNATEGIEKLSACVDTITVIPNDRLWSIPGNKDLSFQEGIAKADEVLHHTVQGITEIISNIADINLDFRDIQTAMSNKGIAHVGIGAAEGENRSKEAVKLATENPLLETTIKGASDVIVFVRGKVKMVDTEIIGDYIIGAIGYDVQIIYGVMWDDSLNDTLSVTIIAAGRKIERKEGTSLCLKG